MNDISPLVSVILPCYNAGEYIEQAILSIINQTYKNLEIIIVDDYSTDNSLVIIEQLAKIDDRIFVIKNSENLKLIKTLNNMLEIATGKYIARMDADDISMPDRIKKQVDVLETNSNIVVCGTNIEYFGHRRAKNNKFICFEKSDDLKMRLILDSCFAHPSVMIRRDTLVKHNIRYNEEYQCAEDYKLWIDLSRFGEFYNLQEILLKYRVSDNQISSIHENKMINTTRKCRREYIFEMFHNTKLNTDIEEGDITIKTLKEAKKYASIELYEVIYLSLSKYRLKELLYFIGNFDFLKFSIMTVLRICKRFVLGKNPLV
jgi:glycosyltransferase involved in cell wall biosynthesis